MMNKRCIAYLGVVLLLTIVPIVLAHGGVDDEVSESGPDFVGLLWKSAVIVIILIALLYVVFEHRLHDEKSKNIFHIICFVLIAAYTVGITGYLMYETVSINFLSWSHGPVHWHADFEIWACGERVTLPESTGLMNRVGTPTVHHHNDYRIHIEGVLMEREYATLGYFLKTLGGELTDDSITMEQADGSEIHYHTGDSCPQHPDEHGSLVVFVNGAPIEHPAEYIISPYPTVPPGDVVKIVFGTPNMIQEQHHGS